MMLPIRIRPYETGDGIAMAEIYRRAVSLIGLKHYTGAQVEAWLSLTPSADRLDAMAEDGRTVFIAADENDAPVAFTDLEPDGHIHFLYCDPNCSGQGVTGALHEKLEETAREKNMPRLFVEASETARSFYEKRGFTVLHRRDLSVTGVAIHNYAMEKNLSHAGRTAHNTDDLT